MVARYQDKGAFPPVLEGSQRPGSSDQSGHMEVMATGMHDIKVLPWLSFNFTVLA
jgi:hypothetical protein